MNGHVQCVSKVRTFSRSSCDKEQVTHPMDPQDCEASMKIRQLQVRDQDLEKARKWLTRNKRPPFYKIRNCGYVIKSLWSQWNDLRLKNGILYRVSKQDGTLRAVIPFCEKRNIIQQSNDDKTLAHLGVGEALA